MTLVPGTSNAMYLKYKRPAILRAILVGSHKYFQLPHGVARFGLSEYALIVRVSDGLNKIG